MDVDVTYEGLVLMRGATITTTANGPFIGLGAPMPVGTNLVLAKEGASFEVRVARVQEGTGAGIFLTPLDLLERLSPSAPGVSAPPESRPEPAIVVADEAPAPVEAATEPTEPQSGSSAPEAPPEGSLEGPEVVATAARDSEVSPTSPAEAALAAPPDATPESPAPAAKEAVPGAVTQVMDPSAVTAPVAAGDIIQEMPLTNTGSVQAPSKSEGARDNEGDAGKKGRRRNSGRGRKGR
jgi:ribonuclease E